MNAIDTNAAPQPVDPAAHALALLASVSDPAASRARLEEILAATTALDAAREAAERAGAADRVAARGTLAEAQAENNAAAAALRDANSIAKQNDVREAAMKTREAVNERRRLELEDKAVRLQAAASAQIAAIAACRTWLEKVESAAP
jgi:hypothetical protein